MWNILVLFYLRLQFTVSHLSSPTKISQSSADKGSTNTWRTDETWWHGLRKPWEEGSIIIYDSGGIQGKDQTAAHCETIPALHLSGLAFLPVVDIAPLYGCPGWRRSCCESSWGKLEIRGPMTTPKPDSEQRHTKI